MFQIYNDNCSQEFVLTTWFVKELFLKPFFISGDFLYCEMFCSSDEKNSAIFLNTTWFHDSLINAS